MELSPASAPSTLTMFPRARAPPTLNPLLGAGPIVGETSRVDFEFVNVKLRKFLPLMGRLSMRRSVIVSETSVLPGSMGDASVVTTMDCCCPFRTSCGSNPAFPPTVSVRDGYSYTAKFSPPSTLNLY